MRVVVSLALCTMFGCASAVMDGESAETDRERSVDESFNPSSPTGDPSNAPPGSPPAPPPSQPPSPGTPAKCGGAGTPIAAPADQWSWIPDAQMKCGNGSSAGFAVKPSSKSTRLVVFLMGGGGCFDGASCTGKDPSHQAAHLNGYGAADAQQEIGQLGAGSIFDPNAGANPFKNDSWVFIPYCTGDFHSGTKSASYGTQHVGRANVKRVLDQIVPTFCPAVTRVVLMGSSAGGFGAVFNYEETSQAFAPVRVDLVDDCGPPMGTSSMPLQSTMKSAWNMTAPPACSGCTTGWNAYLPFLAAAHPNARFSLLASTHDFSICPFFGMPAPETCKTATKALATQLSNIPNLRVWMTDEFAHVFATSITQKTSQGVPLAKFVSDQIGDAPSWSSVVPP
jgi:hypothetical protein